jgi:hypothetical protein
MTDNERADRKFYARVHNFPNKMANLRAKIIALRDEAEQLGYRDEAAWLAGMAAIACSRDLPQTERKKIEWTQADINALRKLWRRGLTGSQIAREIGRSRPAVLAAARRHGLEERR